MGASASEHSEELFFHDFSIRDSIKGDFLKNRSPHLRRRAIESESERELIVGQERSHHRHRMNSVTGRPYLLFAEHGILPLQTRVFAGVRFNADDGVSEKRCRGFVQFAFFAQSRKGVSDFLSGHSVRVPLVDGEIKRYTVLMENNLDNKYTRSSNHLSSDETESAPGTDIIFAGRKVYQAVEDLDAAITARLGINRSDLQCLNLLEGGAVSPKDIRERLGLSSGAVTALIDRLENAGYVRRTASTQDRRSIVVEITPEVFARLGKLYRSIAGEIVAQFGGDSPDDRTVACTALLRFAAACETARASLPE